MNTKDIQSYKNEYGVEMKPTCRLMWDKVRDKEKGGMKTALFQLWASEDGEITKWHEVPRFTD